ncbi:UMF1 family MFS transporter [Sphingobacterium allocomposti]|jgi:UMF1 family MFS transporter|uniref:UMF1 family MFS transporter n=1 Tax=Sphingobacterium allocomposti TaxID=415956 RepID=A0A5S5DFF3_9SPHI|nr:MFS transporter [Sphingobacterium composti Yoo et al. 2007 non Ten et al. 2007]TYP94354.1 UMF1 family MFS transporter [Sphingobacterium composti Yoo et al. 2007 non Ten et al. 2007]HLS94421.1 MFS transporter [Sphingobacterium sp.]
MQVIRKNDKRLIRSWSMYDWANSAYNLVITSTIFPAYYTAITTTEERGDVVVFFGVEVINTALSNFTLALAYLIMAVCLPFLSAYADVQGRKKQMMMFFTYFGAFSCMGLFFFKLETLELGIILFGMAAMGYIGGVLFNNSYLPEIATPDRQDKVSAQGFAYGYVGCVTLQIICLIFILKPDWFGITDGSFGPRLSFLLVGLWWAGFSNIPFRALPNNRRSEIRAAKNLVRTVVIEFKIVLRKIKRLQRIRRFLPAYFFYAAGVQTVMIVAAAFGAKELQLESSKLIITILLIQLVAILGAILMSRLSSVFGNIKVLISVVLVWLGICVASFYITTEIQFYILACIVGLVMGGIQSLSRSTYSKLLPENVSDTASFFSFYDVTEKLAIVMGLVSFALIEQLSHNIRYSALFLSVFFIIGGSLLLRMLRFNKALTP